MEEWRALFAQSHACRGAAELAFAVRDEHVIAVPLLMGQPSLLDAQNKLSERALSASETQVADIDTFPLP